MREIRKERGISQENAALHGDIDRAYYGHIERATKNATLRTLWKIAHALDVTPADLVIRAERILEAPPGPLRTRAGK
jgi:transcriptional regulator with XRE-family HTH domain